jgi:hypothetical protein
MLSGLSFIKRKIRGKVIPKSCTNRDLMKKWHKGIVKISDPNGETTIIMDLPEKFSVFSPNGTLFA